MLAEVNSSRPGRCVKFRIVALNFRMDVTNSLIFVQRIVLPHPGILRRFTTKNTVKKRGQLARLRNPYPFSGQPQA